MMQYALGWLSSVFYSIVSVSCPACNEVPALVSSISVFIFASLLLFIIGFLSGYFTPRFRCKHANSTIGTCELPQQDDQTQDQQVYKGIPAVEHQNVELEENAAYSAARSNDQHEL